MIVMNVVHVLHQVLQSPKENGELQEAYDGFLHMETLDVSSSGSQNWETQKKSYNEKVDRIETSII